MIKPYWLWDKCVGDYVNHWTRWGILHFQHQAIVLITIIDPVWPSDAIWHQAFWLTGPGNDSSPSHFLNQYWLIVNWTHWNKFQWNLHQNIKTYFQNVVHRMTPILSRSHCLNNSSIYNQWWIFRNAICFFIQGNIPNGLKYNFTNISVNGELTNAFYCYLLRLTYSLVSVCLSLLYIISAHFIVK